MTQRITIDPITRLEGHGKIEIFLNEEGDVANTYFQIPELRGFERFCVGRPVEEMPLLTNRICGVCPEAHHMAAAKAADAVYHVDPPRTAKMLRELLYSAFYVTDHATHFYALGGPDFVMGPDAPVAERNILGVIHKVGLEIGGKVIAGTQSRAHRCRDDRRTQSPSMHIHPRRPDQRHHRRTTPRNPSDGQMGGGVRPILAQALQRYRARQQGLRGLDPRRYLYPSHLLHGHGGREQQNQLLRWQSACGGPRGQGIRQVCAERIRQAHRRTR